MISRSLRKTAADSNVILSAAIGKAALKVFMVPDLEIVTTQFNFQEVREYLPVLAARYKLDEFIVTVQLNMLPLTVLEQKVYRGKLAALALSQDIPVWSNDRHFDNLPLEVYPTARLLNALGVG